MSSITELTKKTKTADNDSKKQSVQPAVLPLIAANTEVTGSVAVLDAFLAEGVDVFFGYPGGAIMPI